MTSTQNRPIVRDYALVSLGALSVITLLLVQLGLGWWSALPLLVASAGAACGSVNDRLLDSGIAVADIGSLRRRQIGGAGLDELGSHGLAGLKEVHFAGLQRGDASRDIQPFDSVNRERIHALCPQHALQAHPRGGRQAEQRQLPPGQV